MKGRPGKVDLTYWATAGSIVLIDLVLSGDNALVIGAAASKLPRAQRYVAIIWGGAGAIVLRMALAIAATLLLTFPLLRAIGGVLLIGIAIRLLLPDGAERHARGPARGGLLAAVVTILIADVSMSLDNVLAVGALARGDIPLLVGGLLLSMLLLFVASALVARVIARFPLLLHLAALVLAWTAGTLIVEDEKVIHFFALTGETSLWVRIGCVALVVVVDALLLAVRGLRRGRRGRRAARETADVLVASGRAEGVPADRHERPEA